MAQAVYRPRQRLGERSESEFDSPACAQETYSSRRLLICAVGQVNYKIMSTKKPSLLPSSLSHLQPFVNALAKLPAEELNEDIDASRLDSALRKRQRGLDLEAATLKLDSDREQLRDWLNTQPDHPAHWVLGYLSLPDIAEHLSGPMEPIDPGPTIAFELPAGWRVVRMIPFRLDFKKGKVHASITALDELGFESLRHSREQPAVEIKIPGFEQPRMEGTRESADVVFGPCRGRKYVNRMTAPAPWKQVDYLLSVPGGYVSIWLGTMTGAEFDEAAIEVKLHTVGLTAST